MLFKIIGSLYLNEFIEEMKKCYLYKSVCMYSKKCQKCNFYVTSSEFVQRVSHKKQTKLIKKGLLIETMTNMKT